MWPTRWGVGGGAGLGGGCVGCWGGYTSGPAGQALTNYASIILRIIGTQKHKRIMLE